MANDRASKPVRQHWVPQFYLSYFATPESRGQSPKIWFRDKETGGWPDAPTDIGNICGKRYLYSPLDACGVRDWTSEEMLGRIETEAGVIWPSLVEETPNLSSPEIREPLARFVGMLHLRNFHLFNIIKSTIELARGLFPLTKSDLAERSPDDLDPTHPGRHFAKMLQKDEERITALFSRMRWKIFLTNEDAFITTDRPVTFLRGVISKNESIAILPLSPRRILWMQYLEDSAAHDYFPMLSPTHLSFVNWSMSLGCLRYVITGRTPESVDQELATFEAEVKARS